MTLCFVGTGLGGAAGMPAAAREAISGSQTVYVESFTSPAPDGYEGEIRAIAGGEVIAAPRWMVEDGQRILDSARAGAAALVCAGDPFVATTHAELRARAAAAGIRTSAVHAPSILTAAVGECGLHHYKVGRTATLTAAESATPHDVLQANIAAGSHTVLLLEYDQERGESLDPAAALRALQESERARSLGAVSEDTFAIVASRVGRPDQQITAGRIGSLARCGHGGPPHTIIVPGTLHFTESDALRALARCVDEPSPNTHEHSRESRRMVARYAPMVRGAIEATRPHCEGHEGRLRALSSAADYVDDAENFARDARDGLAVLSVGYADGLVDSLRISMGLPCDERGEMGDARA